MIEAVGSGDNEGVSGALREGAEITYKDWRLAAAAVLLLRRLSDLKYQQQFVALSPGVAKCPCVGTHTSSLTPKSKLFIKYD